MIFLDVLMPRMDGWAVLSALKADPKLMNIPVIMLTLMNEAEMGYMLGAAEYLTKPIDRDRLVDVLEKYHAAGAGAQVLIVEDDEPTRDVIRRRLPSMDGPWPRPKMDGPASSSSRGTRRR